MTDVHINKGGNGAKVRTVENVDPRHVPGERHPPFCLKGFEKTKIASLVPRIAQDVPTDVAERCPKCGVRLRRIGYETHIFNS